MKKDVNLLQNILLWVWSKVFLQCDLVESTQRVEKRSIANNSTQSRLHCKYTRENCGHLVCSILDLSFPPKHCHTTDIALHCSLKIFPVSWHSTSNRTHSMGFCKQVWQLFSSVNVLYPNAVIKVSLPQTEVLHLNVLRPFVILRVFG